MAIERIPADSSAPYYEIEIELDGVEFKLEFSFNDRDDAWYMTISSTDDTLLRAGIRIVNEWVLLRLWAEATRPEGEIVSVNQGEVLDPPTLEQLGEEVVLTYLDADEIASITAQVEGLIGV